MAYTLGSLFTGLGGIDLAFQWAGFEIAWQVEIDDRCNRVLEQYWPAASRLGDVRGVSSGDTCRVDVLAGGFPCQPFSIAGLRRGADDPRNMWPEFRRLIGEFRSRVVFLENVPAILAGYGGQVTADLAASGYVGAWDVISAADAGASHLRERWYCVAVAYSGGVGYKLGEGQSSDGLCVTNWHDTPQAGGWSQLESRTCGPSARCPIYRMAGSADGLPAWMDAAEWWRGWPAGLGQPQHAWEPPRTVADKNTVPDYEQRTEETGNAVVPQVVYPIAVEIRRALEVMDAIP